MLSRNSFTQEYIDQCRARVAAQVAAFKELATAAGKRGTSDASLATALESFEPEFFNNMVLVLEGSFVHRGRTIEGKDGNPLNEVRMLCISMLEHDGRMTADKSIKLDPATSVLHQQFGSEIRLSRADFVALSDAFFAEIERKYV
ncbi:MAG: hypothetical protein ACXW2C_01365 [Acidimicrobiia bacterium]